MARPREYDRSAVIEAAKETFWRNGYEGAGLDVLERATHLSRSSIYLAFGSKRALFSEAMEEYRETFIESILGPMEGPGAGAEDAATFFATIGSLFRGDLGSRGCLMINAVGELGGRDPDVARQGAELFGRLRAAFANALSASPGRGGASPAVLEQRGAILAASAMGVWITSRVDPGAAADACDAIVEQIVLWIDGDTRARPRRRRA